MSSRDRVLKIIILVGTLVLLYSVFEIYDDTYFDSRGPKSVRFVGVMGSAKTSIRANVQPKKILFWNSMWDNDTFYFGKGDIFKNCAGIARHCWATNERARANIEDFDAVLFHGCGLNDKDVPLTRRATQNYVFVNLESPLSYRISYGRFANNFFNATMTYRLDSDVTWSYGYIENIQDRSIVAPSNETLWSTKTSNDVLITNASNQPDATVVTTGKWSKKTKTAVWFVSNCKAENGRDKYVEELAMNVDVDVFGKCGNKNICPRGDKCFRDFVEPNYYFYLSFENSMCQDYVTEKFFNVLRFDVVPVVYGGANYSLFAPPKSYINALDFDSPKELAMYLKKLIAEPTEYEKYFEWKKTYKAKEWEDVPICRLCRYLHQNKPPKSYSQLSAWYTKDKCAMQKILERMPYVTKKNSKIRPQS